MNLRNFFYHLKNARRNKRESIERQILSGIGNYYFSKQKVTDTEMCNSATKEIQELGISRVEFKKKNIYITLARPGYIIGVKGSNLEAMNKHLKDYLTFEFNKIKLVEEKTLGYLYSYLWIEEDW